MAEADDPRLLVCHEYWTLLFSRDEYRTVCQSVDESVIYEGPPYMIPFKAVEDLAASGRSWCSFVLSGARQEINPVPLQDEYLTIDFSWFSSRHASSPAGNNRASALVNGNPLFGAIFVREDSVVIDIGDC